MQRRIGHSDACHLHRLQTCNRGYRTGPTDLELHVEQFGEFLAGGELVGDGPARLAGAEAEFALELDAIDLEHHAIDLVRQAIAALADVLVIGAALGGPLDQFQLTTDRNTPVLQGVEHLDLGARQFSIHPANTIGAEL
ncbi:hypothetical protein D9M71_615570 [compost metagenome]